MADVAAARAARRISAAALRPAGDHAPRCGQRPRLAGGSPCPTTASPARAAVVEQAVGLAPGRGRGLRLCSVAGGGVAGGVVAGGVAVLPPPAATPPALDVHRRLPAGAVRPRPA